MGLVNQIRDTRVALVCPPPAVPVGASSRWSWVFMGGPVHHGVAAGTGPRNVAIAVTKAYHVPDKDLMRAEAVPVGAAGRWMRDPLPGRGLYELTQHNLEA